MPTTTSRSAILCRMHTELEDRLLELLQHDDDEIFAQGLEMLRAGGWSMLDRYLIARALCDNPVRAIAVMANTQSEAIAMERRYAGRCLQRLANREKLKQRTPPPIFGALLPVLLASDGTQPEEAREAAAKSRAACQQLRDREQSLSSTDPIRYSGIRLLEVLADVLEDVGRPHQHVRVLVRQLLTLEPRMLVQREERYHEQMCRTALEETLLESCGAAPR